jgi:uncharacterized repeat protein (TIGR01451 family)
MFDRNTQVPPVDLNSIIAEAARRISDAITGDRAAFYTVFGRSTTLDSLLDQWAASGIPIDGLQIVSGDALPGLDGAYDAERDLIFLSSTLVDEASTERQVDVLIEELAHRLDAYLGVETSGDEGRALSTVLRGEPLPETLDDETIVDLPGYGPILVEAATSISDSGGYEGSSQILPLETAAGSTINYYYQHYSIPDRFILRYEGRNVYDTGFTGGSRSGSIELPPGNATELQVIVATDNQGTAWNYRVSAEGNECEDTAPWRITAQGDGFERNPATDYCETTGTITVGRVLGADPLINVAGTSAAAYNQTQLKVTGGTVYSAIGAIPESLFSADFDLNFGSGEASLSNISSGTFKLAGLDVDFKSMKLLSDKMAFDVLFRLPDEATGLIVDTVDFFDDALRITASGATPVLGFRLDPPGKHKFDLAGFLEVEASNLAIEYRGAEDALRLQAKLALANKNFGKTDSAFKGLEADLSGPNYIEVDTDGKVEVIGSLKASGEIGLVKGWSLKELALNINTKSNEVGGSATLGTPFGLKFGEGAEAKAEVEFLYDPFQLDKVGLGIDNLNKPIPAYPAFFFQKIGGSVDNFAPANPKDVEGTFTIGASLGPQIAGTSLAKSTFDAKVSAKSFTGGITSDILTANFTLDWGVFSTDLGTFTLIKDVSTATLDWSKGEFSFVGTSDILDGFAVRTGGFKADSSFNFSMWGSTQLSIPNFVPTFGGTKIANSNLAVSFTNDSNYANDYAAGWGQYTVNTWWDTYNITLGLRVNFDGSVERIGAGNIPKTSSWFIEDGRDYVMLTAHWENPSTTTELQVIMPDGTVITEDEFSVNKMTVVEEFSSDTSRTVIIGTPEEGTWDLEVVDDTGLGTVFYEASGAVESPEFEFTGTPQAAGNGLWEFGFDAVTHNAATSVTFYYDDDLSELDGKYAGQLALTTGSGNFVWDSTGVVPDDYFLYAMVDDGEGPIVFAETDVAVSAGSAADLSVEISSSTADPRAGDTVTYQVQIKNLSPDTAFGATALLDLSDDLSITTSSIPSSGSDFSDYSFDVGDIAGLSDLTFTIEAEIDGGVGAGAFLGADVYVMADTYDPEAENDSTGLQMVAAGDPPGSRSTSLSVDSKLDLLADVIVNDTFVYTVSVTNQDTTATASNVELRESATGLTLHSSTLGGVRTGSGFVVAVGSLAPGESKDVQFTATAERIGTARTTSVVSADGFETTITDNEELGVLSVLGALPDQADLSLTLDVVGPDDDGNLEATVSLTNDGPGVASDVEVEVRLPQGVIVESQSMIQGTFDETTGVWALGNLRDSLTRDLVLSLSGTGSRSMEAEVVSVSEVDPDSAPNDGEGDDYAQAVLAFAGSGGGGRAQSQSPLSPQGNFNEEWYLANNPDVAAAVHRGEFGSGWHHYVLFGQSEGRTSGEPLDYGVFNEGHYLAMHPDVAMAVEQGVFGSGWQHYQLFGMEEGRLLGPPEGYDGFNEEYYLANNPDVAVAVREGTVFGTGWQHYELFGRNEGRSDDMPDGYGVFDELGYLAFYSDVGSAVESGVFGSGWHHYQTYGAQEGRAPDPYDVFDEPMAGIGVQGVAPSTAEADLA